MGLWTYIEEKAAGKFIEPAVTGINKLFGRTAATSFEKGAQKAAEETAAKTTADTAADATTKAARKEPDLGDMAMKPSAKPAEAAADATAQTAAKETAEALGAVKKSTYSRSSFDEAQEINERLLRASGKGPAEAAANAGAKATAEGVTKEELEAAVKKAAEEAVAKSAKEAADKTAADIAAKAAAKKAAAEPLSWYQANRIARDPKKSLSDKLVDLTASDKGVGSKFVDRVIASARSKKLNAGEMTDIRDAAARGDLSPEIVARVEKFYRVENKWGPEQLAESIAAKGGKIAADAKGFAQDPLKTMSIGAIDAGIATVTKPLGLGVRMVNVTNPSGMVKAWKDAGIWAVGGWAAWKYGPGIVGSALGGDTNGQNEGESKMNNSGTSGPSYENNAGAKTMSAAADASLLIKDPAKFALQQAQELLNSESTFNQARGAALEIFKRQTNSATGAEAIAAIHDKMVADNFSDAHVALFDKFMDDKTSFKDLKDDEKAKMKDLIEYYAPSGNVDALKQKFTKNGLIKTAKDTGLVAAGGLAPIAMNAGGKVLDTAQGVAGDLADDAEDLAGLGSIAGMLGIESEGPGGMVRNAGKSMKDFAVKNPVAAGLGTMMGMNTQGGTGKKLLMGLVWTGIINFVMNLFGITSDKIMGFGKSVFNGVMGPVTGINANGASHDFSAESLRGPSAERSRAHHDEMDRAMGVGVGAGTGANTRYNSDGSVIRNAPSANGPSANNAPSGEVRFTADGKRITSNQPAAPIERYYNQGAPEPATTYAAPEAAPVTGTPLASTTAPAVNVTNVAGVRTFVYEAPPVAQNDPEFKRNRILEQVPSLG